MSRHLEATIETFPIAGKFTISRGSKTEAEVITCTIHENGVSGRGECVPYKRYGESLDGVLAEIRAAADASRNGLTREELQMRMKPGAARNAIDCALWDLESKLTGHRVAEVSSASNSKPFVTAFTLSLGEPEAMAAEARKNAGRPLLKVKLGTADDEARLRAVREAAPDSRLIVDAN